MGSLSDYSEDALLDHILHTAYSSVATVYLALATGDPTDAGTGASMNEVANSNGYARTAITLGAAASRRVTQSGDVTFPLASGSWGTVSHWAILDSGTHGAGNMLAHGAFNSSFPVVSGNTPTVPTTEVYVEISATGGSDGFSDYAVHALLNLMFRNVAFTSPTTYVALATAVIDDQDVDEGDVTEVSGGSYARVLVNESGGSTPAWNSSSGGAADNADDITFPTPTASWGTVTSMFLCDSASGATNVLAYGNSVVDQEPVTDDTVDFLAGALDLALT